jgi:hypothetical protein
MRRGAAAVGGGVGGEGHLLRCRGGKRLPRPWEVLQRPVTGAMAELTYGTASANRNHAKNSGR